MIRLLVVLGEGGHTKQMLRLVELLGPGYEYHYVAVEGDDLSTARLPHPGPVYRLPRPRSKVRGRTEPAWRAAWNTLRCAWRAWKVLRQVHPQVVLGAGPAISVPVSLVGKVLGAKVIHVESASRVRCLSLTGRILYPVADLFFVQWEGLRERHPKAIYAGRLW